MKLIMKYFGSGNVAACGCIIGLTVNVQEIMKQH